MTKRIAWRILQVGLAAVLVALVARDLIRNWRQLTAEPPVWDVRLLPLLAAAVLTWSAYLGLIWSWRTLLAAWGRPIAPLAGARVWALASLGRYLPGKVWTIAGMALLSQRLGVPLWMSAVAAVLFQLVAITTGIVASALTGGQLLSALEPSLRISTVGVAVAAAAAAVVIAMPPIFRRLVRMVPGAAEADPPPVSALLIAGIANLGAWICYGVAFWLVAEGTLPNARLDLPTAIAAYTTSYLIGFLAAFAPGGLGVRESVLIVVLRDAVGLGEAAALAIASRFFITVVELGFVLPFALLGRKAGASPTPEEEARSGEND